MNKYDANRILRLLPFFAGGLGGFLLLINRLLTAQITDSQARSDALGVIEGAVLILVGLLWQQIQGRTPDTVDLIGETGLELDESLSESAQTELAWASHLLLTNTVTRSLLVYYDGKTILRRGVFGKNSQVKPGAILERAIAKGKPVYLVNLSLYPGKLEFDYLPENTQGVICQPIGTQGALILGANAPRSYTKKDEQWIAGIADKLAVTLNIID
ncbi:cofactor assembly of complex C subunit B [Pleurocapsa sp. CCALA 161]|uniref:cofactor assembly of complex C subunit B n=1 Tax=Pleurocapsa sp. CCALA 161 TaxID=2107688 RepID=UPI000D052A8B|nr:cofactor assembly of complex C subunit B [Pleurocapsa sp. CCALA 161]PSB11005.1 cofactor assembly of complex C subunit B [Pleurocapsa sp. CCALA 161]